MNPASRDRRIFLGGPGRCDCGSEVPLGTQWCRACLESNPRQMLQPEPRPSLLRRLIKGFLAK
jgi:hypothetical protein